MKKFIATAAFSLMATTAAYAGPQYIDGTGFAVSGYDVVAYHGLKQSDVGTPQPKAIPGKKSITAEFNGAKFAFATEENKKLFVANPGKYATQFDGHCAYGVSVGGKVPANPHLWRIVDGKLYLNITTVVVGFWEKDIPGNIKKGGANWGKLDATAASTRVIPKFTSPAPVAN